MDLNIIITITIASMMHQHRHDLWPFWFKLTIDDYIREQTPDLAIVA